MLDSVCHACELIHMTGHVKVTLSSNLWPTFLFCFLSSFLDLWELLIYFESKLIVGFIGCKRLCHLHDYSKLVIFWSLEVIFSPL